MATYRVRAIWNVLYPAMKDASLVSDCLPEPPTPTSRALPPGLRMMRDICRESEEWKGKGQVMGCCVVLSYTLPYYNGPTWKIIVFSALHIITMHTTRIIVKV